MAWRLAKSLAVLRDQVNAFAPGRSKSDDGTIGDAAHAASKSDHNPNDAGVVCAIDFTHDPRGGFDSYEFAEMLRRNRDPRIQYVISNGRIWNADVSPYVWRTYSGANKHDRHVHISVKQNPAVYDDAGAWDISGMVEEPMPAGTKSGKGSWYSQNPPEWVDDSDEPNSSPLGVPDSQQGVAFYDRSTLGQWFDVTAPNGKTLRLQQTDIGPHPRTGRQIDIAAVAAERFGYTPNSFPTDRIFTWRPAPAVPAPTPTPTPQPQPQEPTRMPALPWATIIPLVLRFGPQVFALLPIISQIIKDWPKIKAASPDGLGKLDIPNLIEQFTNQKS